MNTYSYVGTRVRATASFTDVDGVATDPTAVVCRVRDPLGVITTPSAQSDQVGEWWADIDLDEAGIWWVRFEGTGSLVVAIEQQIFAADSNVV